MKLEEAIKTAIEYETSVRATYAKAVEQTSDPVGKRIFEVLAEEEQGHLDYLQAKLEQWTKTGKATADELATVVPSREAIAAGIAKMEKKVDPKDHSAELDLLKQALAAEVETGAFYQKMVAELDAEGQQLFARFAEIEEGHAAIVQGQIDALSGMGFWFDFMEFNLEGG